MPEEARYDRVQIERAVELHLADADRAWGEIAEELGKDPKTLYRWRHSEQWEIVQRELTADRTADLVAVALSGLRKAMKKGDARACLDVLRNYGFLKSETININTTLEEPRNALKEFMDERSADRIITGNVAESAPDIP